MTNLKNYPNSSTEPHRTPLDFILRNPKLTPIILFVLAVIPFITAALVVALVLYWQ